MPGPSALFSSRGAQASFPHAGKAGHGAPNPPRFAAPSGR